MRQTPLVVLIIIALLLTPIAPTYLQTDLNPENINGRSSFECSEFTYTVNVPDVILDAAFTINDGDCTALILQGITGNEIFDINIVANKHKKRTN